MKVILFVVLLISSVFGQCAPEDYIDCDGDVDSIAEYCPYDFAIALADFYNAFDGSNWDQSTGWSELGVSVFDVCGTIESTPFGVTCEGACPNQIFLSDNSLVGQIDYSLTTSIANLVSIKIIDLSKNTISGDLTNLFSLTTPSLQINLNSNDFIGALPSLPTNIIYLSISNNVFDGTLPAPPATIIYLDVSDNSFTALPIFKDLPNLETLDLSDNQFSGSVDPTNFENCPSLKDISLYSNNLEGELPSGIFLSGNAYGNVRLGLNNFDSFPSMTDTLTTFESLDISKNFLTGPIPEELIVENYLDASYNSLGPTFPNSLAFIGQFLDLSYNNFRSPVPPAFRIAPTGGENGVDSFFLEYNDFDCPLPQWCSTKYGNGHCEPCNSCYDMIPGTLQHNLTECDPYLNFMAQNPPEPVRASNSTDFEFVTDLYGGSFSVFYNLVPGIYYTYSTCGSSTGFPSVFVLKDPKGNLLASNDQCASCGGGHSELTYLHPLAATYSSVTLSVFIPIQTSKHFSCIQTISNDRRSLPLYQKVTYADPFPECEEDYKIGCHTILELELTSVLNVIELTPADINDGSQYCGFEPVINQTLFDCSNRGTNYVEQSFYDYTCVTPVVVTSEAPTYSCISEYIVIQYSPLCTPHGCNLNIYDFPIEVLEIAACEAQKKTTPSLLYAYIGDTIDYHLFYHDMDVITEVICPISFYGLRIIDILDETAIDTLNTIFDISIDYALEEAYDFSPFIVSVDDYDPKISQENFPELESIIFLEYEKISHRQGGVTLHNIDFSDISEGSYYLMAFAETKSLGIPTYMTIGSPIVYIYTSYTDGYPA